MFRTRVGVLGLLVVGLLGTRGPASGAELQCDTPVLDLGELQTGLVLERRVVLRNKGSSEVRILGIRGSCACIKAQVSLPVVGPGRQADCSIHLNTLAVSTPGQHVWKVHIQYESQGAASEVAVAVTAQLVQEIIVQPPQLIINSSRATEHEITVTDKRPRPLTVTAVHTGSPHLKARLIGSNRQPDGSQLWKIHLEIGESLPPGRHDRELLIWTDDEQYRALPVLLTVNRRAQRRVTALPPQVSLAATANQPQPVRLVTLCDERAGPLCIDSVTSSHAAIICTHAQGSNGVVSLRIGIERSKVDAPSFRGDVRVVLSSPLGAEVIIPVTVDLEQ